MSELTKYLRKGNQIPAVQLNLNLISFAYEKWGSLQSAKVGDWIVSNEGEVYTVDGDTFAATYELISPGLYKKTGSVYAKVASRSGSIDTKEGVSHFETGDILVFNNADGTDGYCMGAEKFHSMYTPAHG